MSEDRPFVTLLITLPMLRFGETVVTLSATLGAHGSRLQWRYDERRCRLLLRDPGGAISAAVPAAIVDAAELAALRYVQEVARHPTPLLVASMLDVLSPMVPLHRPCGCCRLDSAATAAELRRTAVLQ